MAGPRNVPFPFRDGHKPSPTPQKLTPTRIDEYGGNYQGNPARGMSPADMVGLGPVTNVPLAFRGRGGR